jgi:hypothetical protein
MQKISLSYAVPRQARSESRAGHPFSSWQIDNRFLGLKSHVAICADRRDWGAVPSRSPIGELEMWMLVGRIHGDAFPWILGQP